MKKLLGLDIGEKRIGISVADSDVKIAIPLDTIESDIEEDRVKQVIEVIESERSDIVVVGMPRNQDGEETMQSKFVRDFVDKIKFIDSKIVFQDESLTSILAKERLEERGFQYKKSDIDKEAASIILQDYIERNYG